MTITVKKTDKRMNGHLHWQYVALVTSPGVYGRTGIAQKVLTLHDVRIWCWDTYGSSCELPHWLLLHDNQWGIPNDKWCWHTENDNFKIYLRTDKEANWFKLKWL